MLGAIVGGADNETLETLSNLSDMIGIAYQLKDDLDDYLEKKTDIFARKFSFLLSFLFENIFPEEKKKIHSYLENGKTNAVIQFIDQKKIPAKRESRTIGRELLK